MPAKRTHPDLHHIVIVGGGAGGLELAVRLGKKLGKSQQARVTLIDTSLTHLWKPLLHQVAAGSMDSQSGKRDYFALAHKHHFHFRPGRMEGLNRTEKQLVLAAVKDENGGEVLPRTIVNYDTLVIAVGSQVNDFDTPGAQQHCIMLDTPEMAERFHQNLINQCLRDQPNGVDSELKHSVDGFTITIIGGGATGVELAAELRMATQILSNYGLINLNPTKELKIVVIDLAERLLSTLPERVSHAVERELRRLNVDIRTNERVTEVTEDSIHTASNTKIPTDIAVWAAGIKGPGFLNNLDGLETNQINQLVVTSTLQTTKDPAIFAIGDCAACSQGPGKPNVPARAQAAHQQALSLAKSIIRQMQGKQLLAYKYKDYGSLISLGDYSTVGNLMGSLARGPIFIEGTIAKIMYWLLHKQHQIVVDGWFHTWLTTWTELINRIKNPRIKLH